MKARTILHVDLDAFFCAVEALLDPSLVGKPHAVGGSPDGRGVIASASYEARAFGVRSAMPSAQALRLCPQLILLKGRHSLYGQYSRQVMDILQDAAPVIEQISIDEAFLDVSDDPEAGRQIAARLQARILQETSLPTSWGVASNKLVAKIATDEGKPNGLVVVPAGTEAEFLAPLPVRRLWGVGPKTAERLAEVGVETIGELAQLSDSRCKALFGEHGPDLAARARGIDDRPLISEHDPRSLSAERTFATDLTDEQELARQMLSMSETVGRRLRKAGLAGMTVKIKLRWSDFTTITRQTKLAQPTDQDGEIFNAAQVLFKQAWKPGRPVRLLGVGVADLGPPSRQLNLFDQSWQVEGRLLSAIDDIRQRFGSDAVRRAGRLRKGRNDEDQSKDNLEAD
ncbi:MAG: DNA polymerase IV [Anaerolineales bacterium]|jgi:DNA polymerase-4